MEEMKKYKIEDVLTVCVNWLNDQENEEAALAFNELQSNLVIRNYMPIEQKELVLRKALIDAKIDDNITPYTLSVLYEIAMLFDCLLAYVVNIDPSMDSYYKDVNFYDILQMSGLIDYILSFCEKDYENLCRLADRMVSFDNLNELSKNLELTSPEQIDRLTNEFKRFTVDTSPEVLKSLGNIAAADDPLLMTIKKNIEDEAYKASKTVGDEDNV